MSVHAAKLMLSAQASKAAVAPDGHAPLYETCAALIVAVMVVIYFDERVRNSLTARLRGLAIGSLGGIIGTGLLIPLFALADFINDTAAVREVTVAYTLIFFIVAFGAAMKIWGMEDGRRLRGAHVPPPPPPPIPLPRGGQTERERAGEVLGAVLANLSQMHPAAITVAIARTGPGPEAERLRNLTAQIMTLQPYLVALSATYPSAEVRREVAKFSNAVSQAMSQSAVPFADTETLASDQAKEKWGAQAAAAFEALQHQFDAVVSALHPGENGNGHRPRARAKPRRKPGSQLERPESRDGPANRPATPIHPSDRLERADDV